jgi:hypothetical protein
MSKEMVKITAVNICVQELAVAHIALGQGLPGHHPATHTAHVLTVPMLV